MKAFSWVTAIGTLVAAQQTALWVPECGDEVLILGAHIADEFKRLNTLSVTDINRILAFQTYTVIRDSSVPAGFKYEGERLVKDPPPQYVVTTCTTTLFSTESATRAKPARFLSTNTQAKMTNTTRTSQPQPSLTPAPTSCYTTGQPVTGSALVMHNFISFCGLFLGITTPTSISSTITYSGLEMLFEVNPANCNPGSGATGRMAISFGSPGSSRPTESVLAFNKALWPCEDLWNIWEYCNDERQNEGRGGFATLGCNRFSLKPAVVSNLSV